MARFMFFFVVALCLVQNFQSILGESEGEASIQNIIKIVEQLAVEIKEIVEDLSNSLPKIVKNLEKSVNGVIEDADITKIFKSVKEEIKELISDGSSTTLESSKMAHEELDDLNKKTKTDLEKCVTEAQKKTTGIKDKVQVLMQKANSLTQEMKRKIEKCAQEFGEDVTGLSVCLQNEVKAIKKLLKQLKDAIKETVDLTENVSNEIADDVAKCLMEVKIDSLKNTEHVIDELKDCIGDVEY